MPDPCCKGVLLVSAVTPVRSAIRQGMLDRDAVEARLEAEDIPFLDEKVNPTSWYPVAILGRYLELTAELMGGASDETYDKLGAIAVETMRAAGTYQQLDFEEGKLRDCSAANLKLFSRLLATIWGAFYNFSTWRIEMAPDENSASGELAVAHWEQVGPLPDCLCPTTRGFIRAIFERATMSAVDISAERESQDHFSFTISLRGS